MTNNGEIDQFTIPSEAIGSIPRPDELIAAQRSYRYGMIGRNRLHQLRTHAVQSTIEEFEATGSKVITDGEQTKPSFLTYPIYALSDECYTFSTDCFALTFADGHKRSLPRLSKPPFRYATYAHTYVDEAKKYTSLPIKQAVITPSALSMVYPRVEIPGYPREQFLADVLSESEKDIRECFASGAHSVQLDFTEARFSMKIDPTGQLLRDFVRLNNRVLDRFEPSLRSRLGVHVCPGGDKDCYHSFEIDYLLVLPALFELHVGNFFLQLSSELDRHRVLSRIRDLMQPWHRVFVGVINPISTKVETPEEVCERVLEAAKYIPVQQLGTTDDCGFSPFDDDLSTPRQIAFAKIRARIEGTQMAEEILRASGGEQQC